MIMYVASGFVLLGAVRPQIVVVIMTVVISMCMVMIVLNGFAQRMLLIWHGGCLNGSECQRVVHDQHQCEKNFAVHGNGSL